MVLRKLIFTIILFSPPLKLSAAEYENKEGEIVDFMAYVTVGRYIIPGPYDVKIKCIEYNFWDLFRMYGTDNYNLTINCPLQKRQVRSENIYSFCRVKISDSVLPSEPVVNEECEGHVYFNGYQYSFYYDDYKYVGYNVYHPSQWYMNFPYVYPFKNHPLVQLDLKKANNIKPVNEDRKFHDGH